MSEQKIKIDFLKIGYIFIPTILFASILITCYVSYIEEPYEIDKIRAHMSHALTTNSPESKLYYLESSYEKLAPFSGNSGWFFPTEETDMDVTKDLLLSAIEKTRYELGTTDKDQWMVLPHNEFDDFIERNVVDLSWRLEVYNSTYMTNPANTSVLWMLVFIPVSIIVLVILDIKVNRDRVNGSGFFRFEGGCW